MLMKFEFGSEAIPYIEVCLLKGRTLAKLLYQTQPVERENEIFTYLPSDTSFERRVRFLEGRITDGASSRLKAAQLIHEFLQHSDRHYAVFEHSLASSSDPWLKKTDINFFTHNSDVYPFLNPLDTDLDRIQNALVNVGSYPRIGILVALPPNEPEIRDRQEVDDSVLQNLAAHAQYIIVGAYDEETVLFWHRA